MRKWKEVTMARKGGETVKAGFYWHADGWEIVPVSGEGGVLPGTAEDRYVRLPALGMLLLAPVMGGLFVVFLPLIGIALLLAHLARLGGRGARRFVARIRHASGHAGPLTRAS
jgi:hypothetical protein